MSISYIAKQIGESATLKLNETAAILRAKGDPVIHLGGGEPKSKPPLDAILAATSLLTSGEVRYTPPDGIPALKQAIIRYTEEFYGWRPAPEQVMASGGAKQAIMSALHAILDPQQEVIFPAPYWVSYPEMVKLVRRGAGAGHPRGRLLHPAHRGHRAGCGLVHQGDHHQQPQQPDGRRLPRAVHRRRRRLLRAAATST